MDNRESKIWLPGICLVLLMCTTSNAAVVQFHEEAIVDGTFVTLGDIAEVRDVDPSVTKNLREIVLGPAPAAGAEKPFRFADIRARLRAVGINIADIEFMGHNVVRVQLPQVVQAAVVLEPITKNLESAAPRPPSPREIQQIEQRFIQAIRETIRNRWPELQLDTVEVSINLASVSATHPDAIRRFLQSDAVNFTGWQGPVDSPQMLSAITTDSRGETIHLAIRCQIEIQPFVLTVAEDVPRGHLVQASNLKWVQASANSKAITNPANVIGRLTKRAIRRGETLEATDLERALLVRSRDIVTVTVRSGAISVRREMKSLSDGALDEPITVMSLTGQDRLTARVTGVHTAEVPSPSNSVSTTRTQAGVSR